MHQVAVTGLNDISCVIFTFVFRKIRCVEMQPNRSSSLTEFRQLWGSWTPLLERIYDDPKVMCLRPCPLFQSLYFEYFTNRKSEGNSAVKHICMVSPSLSQVAQLMNTKVGLYLSSHPLLGLTLLLFGAIAAVPVGLFLTFALVTIVMSAVCFVFFEGRCNHVVSRCFMTLYLRVRLQPQTCCFCLCLVRVPLVRRRAGSAVCALWHRSLLYRGFIHH